MIGESKLTALKLRLAFSGYSLVVEAQRNLSAPRSRLSVTQCTAFLSGAPKLLVCKLTEPLALATNFGGAIAEAKVSHYTTRYEFRVPYTLASHLGVTMHMYLVARSRR